MSVEFHKMHGLGNDFIVLDLRQQVFHLDQDIAVQLADRPTGVGCDQILVLREPVRDQTLASFEIWNADGSQAEQCGNGVRCLGLYLHHHSRTASSRFLLGGPAGIVKIECLADDQVRVDMGRPVFEAHRIPVALPIVDGWYRLKIDKHQHALGVSFNG